MALKLSSPWTPETPQLILRLRFPFIVSPVSKSDFYRKLCPSSSTRNQAKARQPGMQASGIVYVRGCVCLCCVNCAVV